jgi:hypothetical protein
MDHPRCLSKAVDLPNICQGGQLLIELLCSYQQSLKGALGPAHGCCKLLKDWPLYSSSKQ